jgi:hypothetical protein
MLEDVPFDTIDLSTLERLKANGVSESRTIDYKRDEPAKDREAFLANVTSLANTLGGYLLYGVDASEGGGTPSAFPGFGVEDTHPTTAGLTLQVVARHLLCACDRAGAHPTPL